MSSGDEYPKWTAKEMIVFNSEQECRNIEYKYLIQNEKVRKHDFIFQC